MTTQRANTSANQAEYRIRNSYGYDQHLQVAVEQMRTLYQIRNLLITFLVLFIVGVVFGMLFGVVVPAVSSHQS